MDQDQEEAEKVKIYAPQKVFKHQPDATLDQADPASGTKYTLLDTTRNVRIISISAKCTWTVQPSPLEVHLTIDGIAHKFSAVDPVSTDLYFAFVREGFHETNQLLETTAYGPYRAFLIEGRSVKVEVEITGGTVSNLSARVKWAQKK